MQRIRYGCRLVVALALCALLFMPGCGCESRRTMQPRPAVEHEPIVRVRVRSNVSTLTIEGPASVVIFTSRTNAQPTAVDTPIDLTVTQGQWRIDDQPFARPGEHLTIRTAAPGMLQIEDHAYPGHLRLHVRRSSATSDQHSPWTSRFDVINHVAMENYIPGVIAKELYTRWDEQAYRAQAVAARSYAMDRIRRHQSRNYDLEASQASQVYGGWTQHAVAHRATAATLGQVLMYRGQIIPTYYSSTSGGAGLSAVQAFGPSERDIPPLSARSHGQWGSQSPHYQWGPIERNVQHLSWRIADWAKQRGMSLRTLKTLRNIEIAQVNDAGRPSWFTLIDISGREYHLEAEYLRLAANHQPRRTATPRPLPKLEFSDKLRSSFVRITLEGDRAIIHGRGFGHGVGMCQFGAQDMADSGFDYRQILAFYYPQSDLVTLWGP